MNSFYRNQISQIRYPQQNLALDFNNLSNGNAASKDKDYFNNVDSNKYNFIPVNVKCDNQLRNSKKDQEIQNILTNRSVNCVNSRTPSVSKSYAISKENSYFSNNNSKISNSGSIHSYLDRRHQETQHKVNLMRMQKHKIESDNMQFKPKISDNSKKIIDNLIKRENSRDPLNKTNEIRNKNEIRLERNESLKLLNNKNNRNNSAKTEAAKQSNENNKVFELLTDRNEQLRLYESKECLQPSENIKRPSSANPYRIKSELIDHNVYNQFNNNHLFVRKQDELCVFKENKINVNNKNPNNNHSLSSSYQTIHKKPNNSREVLDVKNNEFYNKQYDEEKVLEVRNKLHEYYIQNRKQIKLNENINNKKISDKTSIKKNDTKRKLEESDKKLFEFRKDNNQKSAPIKLQYDQSRINSIKSISVMNNPRFENSNQNNFNKNTPDEYDLNINKRKEDLKNLQNFAENVSVNYSYDNYEPINVNNSIAYSVYNRKTAIDTNQNIKSEFKLDNNSREYLLKKLNTVNKATIF